jgi:YD repeat-containing protein
LRCAYGCAHGAILRIDGNREVVFGHLKVVRLCNLAGNKIAAIDAKEETSTYAFDARGRQVSQTDRLAGVTEFAYTPTGQLASLTDAEDQTTSYSYDDVGNKLVETYPDHVANSTIGQSTYGQIQFVYDAIGRTVVRTDQQGDTCEYEYDLAGRLLSKDYTGHASGPLNGVTDSDTFTYDAASRMLTAVSGRYGNTVTYTYDTAGRKSTEALTISGQTYTVSTAYDAAGQVSGYTYPDGKVVGRTYSDRGQLATLVYDGTTIDTRAYDDGGRMTSSSYNNGVSESRTYNNDNTLAGISFTGAAIGNLTYGWDANKNKTSESIGGTMSGYGFDVGGSGYDSEDRLVNWERADAALDQAWNLSLVGDWNSITENATTQNRTHGPTHELVSVASQSVTHDAKGNMTLIPAVLRGSSQTPTQPLKMKWDFENKLLAADIDNDNTDDVFYKFDALGRRVARTASSATMVYFQSGQQTIADYTAGTAASSPTYNYVYASYIDEPVMRSTGSSGAKHYFHRNQQYSITAITDGSAAS